MAEFTGIRKLIIPKEYLLESQLKRLDLNIDFRCNFSDLIKAIDIRWKRATDSYNDKSSQRSTINIGRSNETIILYDKRKQMKDVKNIIIDTPWSRLELKLRNSKLPTKNIYEIRDKLLTQDFFRCVRGVCVEELNKEFTIEQKEKLNEFRFMLKREGFFSAKKYFNSSRNFDRDFSKLITITDWNIQPSALFKEHIKSFLN